MSVMLSPLSRILPANAPRGVVSDRGSRTCSLRCGTRTRPPGVCSGRSRSPRGFLLFFLIDISSASSSTKFMYSSNPCQVGSSSAQAQQARAAPKPRGQGLAAHNDPPLDPHVCVLEQPDLHPGLLRCGSGHRMKWHRAHKWGLAAAGSKVVQRLQLRQARARTFCRNLKIRFCARDAREGGTAQCSLCLVRNKLPACGEEGAECRVRAAHDRLRHDLLDLGRHGSQRRSLTNLCGQHRSSSGTGGKGGELRWQARLPGAPRRRHCPCDRRGVIRHVPKRGPDFE